MHFDDFQGHLPVCTCMRNHSINSSPYDMNHFLYLLLLFGWKAQSLGGQVGATLLTSDHGHYLWAQKDSTWNTAKINQFMKGVEVTVHLLPEKALLCFPKRGWRVVVVKRVFNKRPVWFPCYWNKGKIKIKLGFEVTSGRGKGRTGYHLLVIFYLVLILHVLFYSKLRVHKIELKALVSLSNFTVFTFVSGEVDM